MTTPSYDDLWRTSWGDMQRLGPVHRHIQEDLVRVVRGLEVRTVLDVGCGGGDNLALLAHVGGYELTGTDVSEEALRLAGSRVPPSVQLRTLDIEHDTLPERFDLVLSVQVVEHLIDDVAALRNMTSMAAKYVLTSTLGGRMRPSEPAIGHVRNYSRIELIRKLELADLEVLWVRGWGFPFYSPLYRTVVEYLPGGPPTGTVGTLQRFVANGIYHLYRLNVDGRGDILSALARPRGS